jgi:transcriptional regulator with XRE-family HTH domain
LRICGKKAKIFCNVRQRTRRPALKALRRARIDAGLTISELAKRAGVSRDTISYAEKGHHSLQASTLSKISRALGRVPSELLAEEERRAPKVRSLSLEPSRFNGADDDLRADWSSAVEEAQRLRKTGRAKMWKALSEWRASKKRGEPYATRREYLDEMGNLLQEVYDADVALGHAYIEAALTLGGSEARVPSSLREESRTTSHFYGELLGLVKSAGLSIRTGAAENAVEHSAPETARPSGVEEADAA